MPVTENIQDENLQPLNARQKAFCEFYVFDWNGTQAAIKAGYSKATAAVIASENLRKPNIIAYINELKSKTAELAGVSMLRVATEYAKLAFTDASGLRKDWMTVNEWENLTDEQKALISSVTAVKRTLAGQGEGSPEIEETRLEFKTHDKHKALEALRKMFGYDLPEKKDITSGGEAIKITLDLTKG